MLAHYRNEMTRSYFVVMGGEEHCASAYQLRMLLGNQVEGLLRVHTRLVDGSYEYYYDITGKQSWIQYLEHHALTREEIARLILGLNSVIESAEKFLLDYHQIILEPGYIYLDHGGEKLYFGYRLDEPMQFEKSFQATAEKLIEKVDHKDREACALAYAVYETALQPGFHMEELLELLRLGERAEEAEEIRPDPKTPEEPIQTEGEREAEEKKEPGKRQWIFCAAGSFLIWLLFSGWILWKARGVFWVIFSACVMGFLNWIYYRWEMEKGGKKTEKAEEGEAAEERREEERDTGACGNTEVMRRTEEQEELPLLPDRNQYRLISMTNGTKDLVVAIYRRISDGKEQGDLTDRE